jgi:uncharacterized small protein (DUF1192 family)
MSTPASPLKPRRAARERHAPPPQPGPCQAEHAAFLERLETFAQDLVALDLHREAQNQRIGQLMQEIERLRARQPLPRHTPDTAPGQVAYLAYAEHHEWLSEEGLPLTPWWDLTAHQREAWTYVEAAVLAHL